MRSSGGFKESLTMALDVVVRNPLRSFLTVLGITIGVTTIIVIGAVINGLNSNVLGQVQSLGSSTVICYRFSWATLGRLSPEVLQRKELKAEWAEGLARLPHVVAAAPLADIQNLELGFGSSNVRRGNYRASNVILQGDGAPYGVLEVDSRSEGEFAEKDIAFLQGAANILGMAIERQRHERGLQAALERQKVLVKEINHRVKNSLQLVAGLLNMQATDDPEIGRLLRQASSRIMAIGRAHDRLYRSSQIEKIELADYLSAICKDLEEVTTNCDVSFEASKTLFLATDRAIGVSLVVTELVVNAARHAYPEGTRGRIWVRLATPEDEAAAVSVRDAG